MSEIAKIEFNGSTVELPVLTGTENEKAVDIGPLRAKTGLITLDTGFKNTGSTQSAITFLDGENGILHYRGYPIEQLADQSNFLEVAYLLIYGDLPTQAQFDAFATAIKEEMHVHENVKVFLSGFPQSAHPMGMLSSVIGALHAFHPQDLDPYRSAEDMDRTIIRLLAKMPVIVAWIHSHVRGLPCVQPHASYNYVEDFTRMMFSVPTHDYKIDPILVSALHKLLILHADHEQNCSTSTVRIVGSSLANLYASISAGINALWGPLHGGANQEVIEMLEEIKANGGDVDLYVNKAKDKNDPFRLMGFGHRVYKNFDPRARIIKKACDDILGQMGINDPVLAIAKRLEEVALQDPYFIERKLYPNVDFYSGIIYRAIGIPVDFFTVMFALGRLPGWIAQWKEMLANKEPIGRPRQIYVGPVNRTYTPISAR
jgi:citrate synthase